MPQTLFTKIFYTTIGVLISFLALALAMKTRVNTIAWFEIASSILLAWYFRKNATIKASNWRYTLNGLMWGNIVILILCLLIIILLSMILGKALS